MKIKKEYIVLAAVIVALSVYLSARETDRTQYSLPELAGLSQEDITKVEITRPEGSVILERDGEEWRIEPEGHRADADRMKDILRTIAELTLTAMVSESKNYSRYNLGSENGIAVKAWSGDTLLREFRVGKPATSFRHTFVRLEGNDRVFHARENFRNRFETTASELRDKTVLAFDQDEIREIHIEKGKESVTLVRELEPVEPLESVPGENEKSPPPAAGAAEEIWKTPEGTPGDTLHLDRMLRALSSLECEEFLEGRRREEFETPAYRIRLVGTDTYTLDIFPKENDEQKAYPALSSQNPGPFLLPGRKAEVLMKTPGDILEKSGDT